MRLRDKTAVITGGGTGIGWGIAQALATEGCRVAIAGRRVDKLRDAAHAWKGATPIHYHAVDVADRQSVAQLFTWAEEKLGQIDILVNAAGINIRRRTLAEIDPAEWQQVMDINVNGAFYCMLAVLPAMRARQDGVIVNISSVAGKRAVELGGVAYNASKFAMTALGTSASLEERKNGIRVTNVYPGEVDTPILEQRPVPVTPEHRARILQPEDIGQLVATICALPPRAHVPEIVIKPTLQAYA